MKTLIFGAGASVPFFYPVLNTSYLTEIVCNKATWDKIINEYRLICKKDEPEFAVNSDIIIKIINHIRRINKSTNFEQIAEIIDKISSANSNSYAKTLNIFLSLMHASTGQFQSYKDWIVMPFLYREIIAETILYFENNYKSVDYKSLSNLQKDFIKYVCSKDSDVSIMSLNYDDCIFESLDGLGFVTGFHKCNGCYCNQIDEATFMYAPKAVYFPHGHIRFQFQKNRNVTFWSNPYVANAKRWENPYDNILLSDFANNYNSFISTGQSKDDGLNSMPYSIYYQRLAIDIHKSDTIYVIGYSFGDEHINRLLHSFLLLNPKNKIFIVDYYPDEITLKPGTEKEEKGLVGKIYTTLEPEQLDNSKNDTFPKGISEINSIGYGELFRQVVLYKKGYKEFLNQFEKVIENKYFTTNIPDIYLAPLKN